MGKFLNFLAEEEKKTVNPAKSQEANKKKHEKLTALSQQLSDAKNRLSQAKSKAKAGEPPSTAELNAKDQIELISDKIRILQRRG